MCFILGIWVAEHSWHRKIRGELGMSLRYYFLMMDWNMRIRGAEKWIFFFFKRPSLSANGGIQTHLLITNVSILGFYSPFLNEWKGQWELRSRQRCFPFLVVSSYKVGTYNFWAPSFTVWCATKSWVSTNENVLFFFSLFVILKE